MAIKIKFGTDGWRAAIADSYTFENVRRCAQGFATYLVKNGNQGKWVVVGYDKRFLSEHFADAVAEVLLQNGLKVYLTDKATPTPVISFSVVNKNACGGVNITASHNPATDNGFKVRDKNGGAIDPEGLLQIESSIPDDFELDKSISLKGAQEKGDLVVFDADIAYIDHLKSLIDLEPIKNAGLKIVVDPMWGNGINWYQRLIGGGKTEIIEIHNVRNPIYPEMKRPEPIPPNINVGLQKTVEEKADVLVIMDGDADRVGIGDENGEFVNQLQVYALLAYYFLEIRKMRGPIVKTLSTTSMLNKLGKLYDVQVAETGVGFKYVAPKMMELNAMIGGEESGGYAFRDHVPERDGILAGLFMLDMMVKTGKKPSELVKTLFEKVGAHYYDRIDQVFIGDRAEKEALIRQANPQTIGGLKVHGLNDTDGFKFLLDDDGWALIRFSGTEPVIRAYCETTHGDCVQDILKDCLKNSWPQSMTSFYDTHCHLYMKHFGNDLEQVLQNSQNQGVSSILVPGIDIETSLAAIQLAEKYEGIFAAVGIHPHDADDVKSDWQEQLIKLSAHPKVVAIGEIGLDFYRNYSPAKIQKEIFQAQLEIALQVHKPIILHERDSAQEIWEILDKYTGQFLSNFDKEWGVFHSFGSTHAFALKAVEHKLMIGVSGPITYKTADEKREIIRTIPLTSLLLETDAPYLTPHPYRGNRNSPEYIPYIAEKIAELKECKIEEVRDITSSNADKLFSWRSVR